MSPYLAAEDLSMFGRDPWWLIVLKAVFCFAFLMVTVLISIVMERKVVAWMQLRIGPNRHGPWGMLQSLADGVKLMLKEDVVVKRADKVVYVLAPIVAAIPAFMAFAVIPFGPAGNEISVFGQRTTMQLTDLPIAMLYILAVASVGIYYGIVLAGWSSGSTYPLLGGLRSCAQMISYEIAMGAAFASVFLYSGSMSTSTIVEAQADRWYVLLLPVSFLIYIVTMVGETNRAPFDMPESEGDLVGGFNTEYSSIKFAMFMLAEYINMVTVSAVAVTLFLGGWRAPWPVSTFWEGANHGWWPMLWFTGKLLTLLFGFVWLRGTLPRVRYDQLMKLGWKVLIPVSLVWLMAVATVRALRNENYDFADIALYTSPAACSSCCSSPSSPTCSAAGARRAHSPRTGLRSTRWRAGSPCRRCPGRNCPRCRGAARATSVSSLSVADPILTVTIPRADQRMERRRPMAEEPKDTKPGFPEPGGRLRRDLQGHVQEAAHRAVPGAAEDHGSALPRTAPAQPPSGRPGEVRRLRVVRLGLSRRRDLRRGRGQHGRGALLARRAVRPRLPDQLRPLHPVRAVHRGVPHARADDDQRVRAGRLQPGEPHLHQGAAARRPGRGHGRGAARHVPGHGRTGLLPRPGDRGGARHGASGRPPKGEVVQEAESTFGPEEPASEKVIGR